MNLNKIILHFTHGKYGYSTKHTFIKEFVSNSFKVEFCLIIVFHLTLKSPITYYTINEINKPLKVAFKYGVEMLLRALLMVEVKKNKVFRWKM